MDQGKKSHRDNEALEACMEPYLKDVGILYPGTDEMKQCTVHFENEQNGDNLTVCQEKGRLLAANNIMTPEKYVMVVVEHSDAKQNISMGDHEEIIKYKDDLCDGHIEFKYKESVQGIPA